MHYSIQDRATFLIELRKLSEEHTIKELAKHFGVAYALIRYYLVYKTGWPYKKSKTWETKEQHSK
jgi:hypothetical protein